MKWESAFKLLKQHVQSESLIKHALSVEAAMVGYAEKWGEDEELWSNTGLLHDIDYEKYPETHPVKGAEMLKEYGFDASMIHAVLAHSDATGIPRESRLDKTLYAVDELAGFIVACVLVRPSRSFEDLEVKSVKKKLKDKAFAKAVDRDQIKQAADDLEVDMNEHLQDMITFLRNREQTLRSNNLSLID